MILSVIILMFLSVPATNTQSPNQSSAPETVKFPLASPPVPEPNASDRIDPQERDRKEEEFKAQQLRQNQIIEWATVVIAAFSIITAFATCEYVWISRQQWRAIKETSDHAGEQVQQMQGQLEAMRQQAIIMRDGLAENRDIFYVGERAYLGIRLQFSTFSRGEEPRVTLETTNAGRTPAWNVRVTITLSFEPSGLNVSDTSLPIKGREATKEIAHVMLAGATKKVDIQGGFVFTEGMETRLEAAFSRFVVLGEVCFRDISNEVQVVPFCFATRLGTAHFEECKQGDSQP